MKKEIILVLAGPLQCDVIIGVKLQYYNNNVFWG